MLEPIGVVKVYIRPEDLRSNPYIDKEYLDLFCREWGVTPESSAMLLECDSVLDRNIDERILKTRLPGEPSLAINGLVPLDGLEYVRCKEIGQLEGYILLNPEFHEALYGSPKNNNCEHPKIVITKGSAKIAENTSVWFSNSALFYIDFLKQLKNGK